MSIDRFINLFAIVTLFELMLTVGLQANFVEVLAVTRNRRIVVQSFLANYLVVPAIATAILWLFHPPPLVAAGLLVAIICPGAAFGPPMASTAKGNVALAIGLMILLAGSSAIVVPLVLKALLPVLAADENLRIGAARMIGMLVLSQLAPLLIGLMVRARFPAFAERMAGPLTELSKLLNIGLIGLILVIQFHSLAAIRAIAYLGMAAVLAFAFLAGWFAGGAKLEDRKTVALTTSVRNVGVGLVVLSDTFPGTPALTAATAFMVVQTLILVPVAIILGRLRFRSS